MNIPRFIYALLASFLMATLGGCQAEEDIIIPFGREGSYQMQFGLSILPPQTRATEMGVTDPLNENKISSLDAFIYDNTGNQLGHHSTTKGDIEITTDANGVSGTATIFISKDTPISASYQGKNCNLYVLANYHGNVNLDNKSESELKAIVLTTNDLEQNTVTEQADFLMDGKMQTGTITWGTQNNYNITTSTSQNLKLSRAAAKIRVLLNANILIQDNKYTYDVLGEPTITLKNYTHQTSLLAGTPVPQPTYLSMNTEQPMEQVNINGNSFWVRRVPYYSYENDWSNDIRNRTYAVIKLHVRNQTTAEEFDSYYSVPLNYQAIKDGMTQAEIDGISKLQRNHLYDIECSIKMLGSAEPTQPVDVEEGYISVEDWNTPDAIDAVISKAHYLVVRETRPEMLNVSEYLIEYLSDLDIDINRMNQSIRHSFTQYEMNGSQTTISGGNKDGQIRVDTISENDKKYLKITSPIPINYVPLNITFTVPQVPDPDDPQFVPLFKNVVVTQYPPIYVTAKESSGNEIYWYSTFTAYSSNGVGGVAGYQSNGTLFKVTTLTPQSGQIVGDPTDGGDYTDRNEAGNNITSPQFIIASQWGMSSSVPQYTEATGIGWYTLTHNFQNVTGITDRYRRYRYRDYTNAENRAYNYWEDDYGVSGTRTIQGDWSGNRNTTMQWTHTFKHEGHWRIPTLAELALIVQIQQDPNSAVKSLLWGERYWSARTSYGYDFRNNRSVQITGTTFVRPVFDTFDKDDNKW